MSTSLEEPGKKKVNPVLATWISMILVAILCVSFWVWQVQKKAGARTAPGAGTVIQMGLHEMGDLDAVWGEDVGYIVWSTTMYGSHELVRMDWPSGRLTRLTRNEVVDSTPKISPDGKRVVFARSKTEWLSFRKLEGWEIWVMDMDSNKEWKVSDRGQEPGWTADGKSVVFQRGGTEVVQARIDGSEEHVLLGPRPHTLWQTPSLNPAGDRLAVTVRGKQRRTSLFSVPGGEETPVAGGCQLAFVPGGGWLVLVEKGGHMKNQFLRVTPDGRQLAPLLDMPGYWSHEYFPRVSNTGKLLVFAAAREGHEHDTADYEIFLWRIGDPPDSAARVSFHTGNDQWPDIWTFSGE